MIHHYLVRGYPKRELLAHFRRANTLTQEEALRGKLVSDPTDKSPTKSRPILITNYHPDNPNLRKIINKHWNIVEFSRDCNDLFDKPLVGFRWLPNLRDQLTNAKCLLTTEKSIKNHH